MCAAGSFKVFINPTMVETGINEWANFSCSLRCDLKQTFNIKWAVGFTIPRGVQTDDTKGSPQLYELAAHTDKTGILSTQELYKALIKLIKTIPDGKDGQSVPVGVGQPTIRIDMES